MLSLITKGNSQICPNQIFEDYDSDGNYDLGENLINDGRVTVSLKDKYGNQVNSFQANGTLCFTDIIAFNNYYKVTASLLENTISTTGLEQSIGTFTSGETKTVKFGYNGNPKICPLVFRDDNSNGNFDSGEVRLGGVKITLKNSNETITIGELTTSSTKQCFNPQVIGEYKLSASNIPTGYSNTTPLNLTITTSFGVEAGPKFGFNGNGNICAAKTFEDVVTPGQFNSGQDILLDNITTYRKSTDGTILETKVTDVVSNSNSTCFNGVAPGQYLITQDAPNGSSSTTGGDQLVVLQPNETKNIEFGYNGNSSICLVNTYNDLNFNESKDENEAQIPGVLTKLYRTSDPNTVIKSFSTSSGGNDCFNNLFPNNYKVVQTIPNGYSSTTGGNNVAVTIASSSYTTLNFGYTNNSSFNKGAIRGNVYIDRNGNGVFDKYGQDTLEITVFDNDVVLTEKEVRLYKKNTTTNAFSDAPIYTITDVNGNYEFINLEPGDCTTRVPTPLGTEAVLPTNSILASTVTTNEENKK